jgi:2-dehydropantoate 2-reductase
LIDYEARRPLEIEAIWGEPLRRARAAGFAMPELEQLYHELKEIDAKISAANVREHASS